MNKAVSRLRLGVAALLVSTLFAGASMPLQAQEIAPEHLELAREYIDLTDNASIYEVTLVETGIQTMRQIVQQNPEIQEETNEAIGVVLQSYRGRKGELLDQFARLYAMRFSMEELQLIVDFYESDVGQKLVQANSEINQDTQRVMRVFEANLKREFFAKVRAELRDAGVSL
ncbi:DUF2059 domain-containing protein [Devosia pacifica]|nr:DUF2059 domain-containing protein [Devosia pacifica]